MSRICGHIVASDAQSSALCLAAVMPEASRGRLTLAIPRTQLAITLKRLPRPGDLIWVKEPYRLFENLRTHRTRFCRIAYGPMTAVQPKWPPALDGLPRRLRAVVPAERMARKTSRVVLIALDWRDAGETCVCEIRFGQIDAFCGAEGAVA